MSKHTRELQTSKNSPVFWPTLYMCSFLSKPKPAVKEWRLWIGSGVTLYSPYAVWQSCCENKTRVFSSHGSQQQHTNAPKWAGLSRQCIGYLNIKSMMSNVFNVTQYGATGRATDLRFARRWLESWLDTIRSGLGQATHTCVPLSPSSIIWYRPRGWSLWLRSNCGPGEN